MKVTLFMVSHTEYQGLYTESELEDLKQELLEGYRDDDFYCIRDIYEAADYKTLALAALGDEESQKAIQEIVEDCEDQYWEDFKTEYVDEYKKEI